jgi:signal peptidase II
MSRVYAIILSFGAFVVALDQWTKQIALSNFTHPGDTSPFLSWWNWTLVHNYGAAFGSFRGLPESVRVIFLLLMPLSVLGLLWWFYVRKYPRNAILGPLAMGFVLGGAVGNLIDRLRFGYVIDFIDWFYPSSGSCLPAFSHFTPDTCHWPVFNVADSAIFVAVTLLIAESFLTKDSPTGQKA